MVFYVKQGKMPATRHTYENKGKLLREELLGEESFEGSYSLLYHRNEPTRIKSIREVEKKVPRFEFQKIHKLIDTAKVERGGNYINGRVPIVGNDNLIISVSKPSSETDLFFRHGVRDQLIFVHKGGGKFICTQGVIDFGTGDYILVPKGTLYKLQNLRNSVLLMVESRDSISIPQRYLNKYGQIKEGVPYYSRDIRPPILKSAKYGKGNYEVYVDFDDKYVVETREDHPFDLEGWDGYLYPFAINISQMMPIVGKVHQPPPVHETFSTKSFMVGTFLPRKFDFHEKAVPISYYHSNVDTDEFLYYASGNFMSRKGISEGSITLHVRGMVHGPQPGSIERSIGKESTDETAVMVESYDRLGMSQEAKNLENKNYMMTWYE